MFYHLRHIRQIKRFTDDSSLQLLVQTFTTTRLDYCNGLLADCSVAVRKRFKTVQPDWFAQSQLEAMLHHYYIHWLPDRKRITYKPCVLMCDVYYGTAPEYLTNLCSRCDDQRLRSSVRGDFVVRRTRTRPASSSFTVAGPAAWNLLPVSIRNTNSHAAFCRQLKTYLFSTSD